MKLYFDSDAKHTCPQEPKWAELIEFVAKPDAPEEERTEKAEQLRGHKISCGKLLVVSTACHGCGDNPQAKHNEERQLKLKEWDAEFDRISALHDAVRMGLIRDLRELSDEEFQMLRIYWWGMEKILKVSQRIF